MSTRLVRYWIVAVTQRSPSRGIVTPEAVLLDFEVAGLASRLMSRLIDCLVLIGGFWALSIGISFIQLSVGDTAAIVVILIGMSLLFFGYPIVAELRMQGRTLGRRALGLRVVTNEGGPIRARHAVVRSLFQLIDLPFGIGVIAGVLTPRTQRCGDLAAGTFVIREPKQSKAVGAVVFPTPPGYEGYISLLDVATLTTAQYELLRSFLLRVLELDPPSRARIADRLARPLARQLRHTPPPTIGAEMFIVCVVAAYQRRHGTPSPVWSGWCWSAPAPSIA
jgi:uncharacterized RDD family membrane protein YckC